MNSNLIDFQTAESDLLACAAYLAERIKSSDGHSEAMQAIVAAYLEKNNTDLAAQFADSVQDPFVRDRLLIDIAEYCASVEDDEYAVQLAEAIDDPGFRDTAFEKVAIQMAAKEKFDKAMLLAGGLGHASNAFAGIAVKQVANGNETAALETVSKIEFPLAKVNALQEIAMQFVKNKKKEKAVEYLLSAVAEADSIEFPQEKIRALNSIANRFLEASKPDKAIEVLAQSQAEAEELDGFGRDTFLSFISIGFLHAGSLELADRALDLVQNKSIIASTLTAYSDHFEANGERQEAIETLDEAWEIIKSERDREIHDSRSRFGIMGTIAVHYASFENPERAIEVAMENPDDSERNAALNQIAQHAALKGHDESAINATDAIDDNATKAFSLIAVSDVMQRLEKKDQAIEFLNKARELCESVPQLQSRSAALHNIASRLYDDGQTDVARLTLTQSLEVAFQILDESHRASAAAALAEVYEKVGAELNPEEKEMMKAVMHRASAQ